jgi:hypothetical protein
MRACCNTGARIIRLVEALPKTLVCRRIGDQLLDVTGKVPRDRLADIIDESTQLRAILSKAVATTKANMK